MSGKLAGLEKRLASVEKALAETAEQEKLADCICKIGDPPPATLAFSNQPEAFEAEMNLTCPVPGFRNLGHLIVFYMVNRGGGRCDSSRFDELLAEYRERESQNFRPKLEHASQEA